MKTSYEEIVNVSNIGKNTDADLNKIFSLAQNEQLTPSSKDPVQRLLLVIDEQKDFMDGGALGVPGACADVERLTRFMYENMNGISKIMASMDAHTPHQIFHPCWWIDADGNHPAPYTIIKHDDVIKNKWRPVIGVGDSITYLKKLEEIGKKELCIWPYHCIVGTTGQMLESQFAKMMYFHSVAKRTVDLVIPKGQDPYSEMYGIIKPEYSKKNFINTPVLNSVEKYDEIYVAGEAASHCLLETVKQICEHFANRPEILQRIVILIDCTSPIPGYEDATKREFEYFEKTYGIKFAKSTDISLAA